MRLVAIDIDGTLYTSGHVIPPNVPPYLRQLEDRGVMVVLCTGRRYRSALPIAREAGVRSPMILHSGALVRNPIDHTTVFKKYISYAAARDVADVMIAENHHPIMWVDGFEEGLDMVSTPAAEDAFETWYLNRFRDYVRYFDTLANFKSDRIFEVCAWGEFSTLVDLGNRILQHHGHKVRLHVAKNIIDERSILEVFDPMVSKWNAIEALALLHDIPNEYIIAIGDNYNDIEMIQKAGVGIAMGNSVPEVAAAADYVTGSNDDDGLLRALKKYFG
jgi:hypothetical protein